MIQNTPTVDGFGITMNFMLILKSFYVMFSIQERAVFHLFGISFLPFSKILYIYS